ncbi:MAG: s-methyl-5-thioribose-1-phosphate isomerase [Tissierellia bacterium]|nr:s-methyl-5-thioribose-1-phosphate isomerase [Tissierellia bacterium]
MERQDYEMAPILRYENVAWYEDGEVKILDRRCYPHEIRYEICKSYLDIANAIRNMVTQSAGPYTAAGMGMALAAYEAKVKGLNEIEYLKKAAESISTARPTTQIRMKKVTDNCLKIADTALKEGKDIIEEILKHNYESLNRRYSIMQRVGNYLADKFDDDSVVMTQCYGETIVGTMLRAAREKGVNPKFIIPETRPFLQGARLTASVISDMGFEHILITDNMAAWAMKYYGVNLFTSAADTITVDGYVVNKVGTYQLAILCNYFDIPYYVTGIPDDIFIDKVKIEFRDSKEVLYHAGKKMTKEGINSVYPSFDICPPELVSGYISDEGILDLDGLKNYDRKIEFY